MVQFEFEEFCKPVAFYPYTSCVRDILIKVDTWNDHRKEVSPEEEDLVGFISDLFFRAELVNRQLMDEERGYPKCSTHRDNKTVIAMSNGETTLYFGQYDGNYYVGLSVWSEFNLKIDLSDLDRLPKMQ